MITLEIVKIANVVIMLWVNVMEFTHNLNAMAH